MIKYSLIFLLWATTVGFAHAEENIGVAWRYQAAESHLQSFKENLSSRERQSMAQTRWYARNALSPSVRAKYLQWHHLKEEKDKWEAAVRLKRTLLALPGADDTVGGNQEADRISYEVIQVLYRYRKEWGMLDTALLNNTLINIGVKQYGFCWHWVEKFLKTLRPLKLQHFDLYWGVAYEGNFRENNSLVIVPTSQAFEEGLMIDAWRSSGRPFWRLVKEDRFPWVKRDESELW